MDRFVNDVMALLNVEYQSGNIVLDACIYNNENGILVIEKIFVDSVKSEVMSFQYIYVIAIN